MLCGYSIESIFNVIGPIHFNCKCLTVASIFAFFFIEKDGQMENIFYDTNAVD